MGPTNRRRDLERGRKCRMKALLPEPPPPVPIPVEISAVIGVYFVPIPVEISVVIAIYFSDQSGNGLSYLSRDAYLL